MADVYDRFDRATRDFHAWAVLRDGMPVGRVVIKYGNAATAFVHLTGSQMAFSRATGGGYDKSSAAVRGAIAKLDQTNADAERGALMGALQFFNRESASGVDWTAVFAGAGLQLAAVI